MKELLKVIDGGKAKKRPEYPPRMKQLSERLVRIDKAISADWNEPEKHGGPQYVKQQLFNYRYAFLSYIWTLDSLEEAHDNGKRVDINEIRSVEDSIQWFEEGLDEGKTAFEILKDKMPSIRCQG